MSDFDVIEYGFNSADETINFGTRCLADGDNLYESLTLASLKCSEQDQGKTNPHINAFGQNDRIYFNVDASMKVFKDKQCSDVIFNASFEAIVDTFCATPDGRYVLVCLRNGMAHLIDCNNEFNCIFSQSCVRDDSGDRYFVAAFPSADSFLIVTSAGQVFRMPFQSDFKMECVYEFNFRAEIASFQYPFLLVNGTKLGILDFENNNAVHDEGRNLKKVFPLDYAFLALDETRLCKICALTLQVYPVDASAEYIDLQLLADLNHRQVIVVTKDESQQSFIRVLSYPDLSTVYSLKVSSRVQLITLESPNDDILYLSQILNGDLVSELRFHVVTETDAEQRLGRLLKRRRYEEAEKFAQVFGLDVALINKARAQEIIDKSICSCEDVDDLVNLLGAIDDDEFRLQSCLDVQASCDKLEDVRKVLTYGCSLQLKKGQEKRGAVKDLQKSVAHLMFRFDTFVTVNRGVDEVHSWLRFSGCDLIEEVKTLLTNYRIEEANIVYSRLDDSTQSLTETHIAEILNVLNNICLATYQPFLPTFVPISLSILPSALSLFVEWTHSRVFYLEKCSKVDFPSNAIKFTETIVGLMRVDDVGGISFQRQRVLHRDNLVELSTLLSTLRTLKTLKDKYGIRIPVTDFLSGPQNVVRFLLTVDMVPCDYDAFLRFFVCKYIVENHMDLNQILLAEVTDLLKYEERCWVGFVGSILDCMSSTGVKLEAVKSILDAASVPWSDDIRKIAHEALANSHELTGEIRELVDHEPMQVVLRKAAYKIKERRIGNVNDLKFIVNRIIYCNEPTMVEDVYKLCVAEEYRHPINMLLITHFIRKGCCERAMQLLDDNGPEEVSSCARELATLVETLVNNEVKLSEDLVDNYYEAAGAIFKRLDASTDFDRTLNEETLQLMRNVRDLSKHFGVKVTTHELRSRSRKEEIVDGVLEGVRCELETERETAEGALATCERLSRAVGLRKEDVMFKLCKKTGDYNVIIRSAEMIYDSESSPKIMCLVAVLLLKYLGSYKLQLADNTCLGSEDSVVFSESNNTVDDDLFCKGLQLARAIAAKAVCLARPDELGACLEVERWVNVSFYCTRRKDSDLKVLFGDVYDSASIPPGFFTFSSIKDVFNAFCSYLGESNDPNALYLTYFNDKTLTEDGFFNELKLLVPVLGSLAKEGQHFTSYKIVDTLQTSLMQLPEPNESILNYLHGVFRKGCVPNVLSSILSNSVVDTDFLYNLLLACELNDSIKFIMNGLRMYKRQPSKFRCISETGLRFLEHHQLALGKSEMTNVLVTVKWWKKFETKKFDYDTFFKFKADERFEFVVNSGCMDMKLAKEYCEDYGLDPNSSYRYLLKKMFQNWKPDWDVTAEAHEKRLMVRNDGSELEEKCREVMKAIDKQQVHTTLKSVWGTVNTYHHEVFIAIINILAEIAPEEDNTAQLTMLSFLKNYQRISTPSDAEKEHWYTNFPDVPKLDRLSAYRLPFTNFLFTKQIFTIIRPELNLKTYKMWFNLIDILKTFVTKNEICSYVVKGVVASGALSRETTDDWILYPKHDDVLAELDECIGHMTNLELATSVAYYLMTNTPQGADQVNAAKLCYKYALRYRQSKPGCYDVERAVTKVETKYYNYCAWHILYTHGLAEKEYRDLVSQPLDLILALYRDERILRKNEVNPCPDINRAAEALASLFGEDVKRIRYNLINDWLSDNTFPHVDPNASVQGGGCSEDDCLKRVAYVCCGGDVQTWQAKLLKMGLEEDAEDQMSAHSKARALKVFTMISDVDTIAELTGLTYDEFTNFIDKLTVVSNLHYLGIALDVQTLDKHNKELLKRLAQRAGNFVVKTMALICMTYKIYDAKYWEFVVNGAIKFSMFADLKSYVHFLNNVDYQFKSFYVNAWQKLIDNSFAHLGDQLDHTLLHNFLTIQACPVLHQLDLDGAYRRCMERGKAEFAAVLLQYLDASGRDERVKEIRNSNKDLDAELNNLAQNGLWGVSHVKAILEHKTEII